MSERILKALMHLFAILAKVEVGGIVSSARPIVHSFLTQQLSSELVNEYLKVFDNYVEESLKEIRSTTTTKKKKKLSLSSVKILKICAQINEELTQKQKIVVLIRIIEFILAGGEITTEELDIITTVAATFNIDDVEFRRCREFIESPINQIPDNPEILIICPPLTNKSLLPPSVKHISSETIDGQLRILRFPNVNIFILRYLGNSELYLNGQIILNNRIYILTVGSTIRSSKVSPIYYSDILATFLADKVKTKIFYRAENIEYEFAPGQVGIHKLDIYEQSGRLVGIMGASGAGKTTLLNILSGLYPINSGKILINNLDLHKDNEALKGVIGYISQDDLLIEDLTVFQNLFYNAKLCFGQYNDREITKIVLELLQTLGLYEVKDLKVGSPLNKKISGGQRKRLNIALELIREPDILFVDEPTSGLSSRDAENVMDLLKELSLKGKLVFVVIHQPSSDIYKMFDRLIILDQGGYLVFYGNPIDAIIHFKSISHQANYSEGDCPKCGNVNPEQIFNILEGKVVDEYGNLTETRKMSSKEWHESYISKVKSSVEPLLERFRNVQLEVPKSLFKLPSKLKQFSVFITRDILAKLANTQYILLTLLEAPLLAFILAYSIKYFNVDVDVYEGYVFRDNENLPVYLLICVIVMLFLGLMVSAEEIFKDRKILKREAFLNLSRTSYLFSKVIIMFIISVIQTATFILIGNAIIEIKDMFFAYWLILFSTAAFANILGLNISATFNSVVTIYIIIPLIIIPQLLLNGVLVHFSKLNPDISHPNKVPIIGEMMTARWAFEAIAVKQFKDNKFNKEFYPYDKIMSVADFKKNFWIPRMRAKIDRCEANINNPEKQKDVIDDLKLLKNEINKQIIFIKEEIKEERKDETFKNLFKKLRTTAYKLEKFEYIDSLDIKHFTPDVTDKTREYIEATHRYYLDKYNLVYNLKDEIIRDLQKEEKLRQQFIKAKKTYQNKELSDFVRNSKEINRIVEYEGELFQQIDPIYLDPVFSKNIRAHYYAPRKKFFGIYLDTFWVNIIVIWAMSLIFFITLYFDFFKKLI